MGKHGAGQMRTNAGDAARAASAIPPVLLGRRRLPPACNDNRPTLGYMLRLALGPLAIVALAVAIWWA